MNLQMHAVRFKADQDLLDFIQNRADKLETFYDNIIDGEVYLRLEKGDGKASEKIVEIKLNVPNHTLFAKAGKNTFEAATDDAVESLRRQIKKFKEKLVAKR
jgi:putative sigma-54 modulation protein